MEIPLQINWSHFTYLGLPLAKEVVNSEQASGENEGNNLELGSDVAQPGRKSDID